MIVCGSPVEPERAAERGRRAGERAAPERVADDRHGRRARASSRVVKSRR